MRPAGHQGHVANAVAQLWCVGGMGSALACITGHAFDGGCPVKGVDRYRTQGVSCRIGDRSLMVVNLSVGGLFVASNEPLPRGQGVALELLLPERGVVRLVGLVAWVNERENPRVKDLPPGFGIKIVRIGFGEKMALLAHLRNTHPGALRRH